MLKRGISFLLALCLLVVLFTGCSTRYSVSGILSKIRNLFVEREEQNILIIGIPNKLFAQNNDNSEIIVMMVPRIIRTTKTSKHIENNL